MEISKCPHFDPQLNIDHCFYSFDQNISPIDLYLDDSGLLGCLADSQSFDRIYWLIYNGQVVLEECHLRLISRAILEQCNLILGNAGRLCNHIYMYCHSAAWILPQINMAVFCKSTQQAILKRTYDICYLSNASFAVIWLAGAEAVTCSQQ